MFNKVYLIGVGLINGSLAKDLKRLDLAKTIVGVGRDSARMQAAQASQVIDDYQLLSECNVADADVVVLGVPVSKNKHTLDAIKANLSSHTIITDVGSTKSNVIQAAADAFGALPANFIPGHPIAGSEHSGFEFSKDNLFRQRRVILTPTEKSDADALEAIKSMWQKVGATVDVMNAEQHDAILSATSHLPHMVAYNLVNYLSKRTDADDIFNYAAGGFYDFTRIASSDPTMWVDICLGNKEKLLESIDGFTASLNHLRTAIVNDDEQTIHALFENAKHMRDKSLLKK